MNASQDALALDLLQWGLLFRLCMPRGGTKSRLAFIHVNLSMLKTSRDWLFLGAAQESWRLSEPGWTVSYRIGNKVWMDWSPQLPKTNGWWTEWYLGCQELPRTWQQYFATSLVKWWEVSGTTKMSNPIIRLRLELKCHPQLKKKKARSWIFLGAWGKLWTSEQERWHPGLVSEISCTHLSLCLLHCVVKGLPEKVAFPWSFLVWKLTLYV